VTRIDLISQQTQLVQAQAVQHLLGDRFVLEELHVARQQRHLRCFFCAPLRSRVLALDRGELLRVVLVAREIPVALFEILLQPRLVVETLAVNRFDFREQDFPLAPLCLPSFRGVIWRSRQ
jgi:hypothetical protein